MGSYPQLRRAPERRGCQLILVRRELYRLLQKEEAVRQYHAAAWERSTGHPEPCDVCRRMRIEQQAIKDTIRHFGGKPR